MGRDEVFENRQPLAEARSNRKVDDAPRRVGHQSAHTGHLADLRDITFRPRVRHDVDRTVLLEVVFDFSRHPRRGVVPHRNRLGIPLIFGQVTHLELLIDELDVLLGLAQQLSLFRRYFDVVNRHGDAGLGRVPEPDRFDRVDDLDCALVAQLLVAFRDRVLQVLAVHQDVLVFDLRVREDVIENNPPRGRLDLLMFGPLVADHNLRAQVDDPQIVGHLDFGEAAVTPDRRAPLGTIALTESAVGVRVHHGHIEAAEHHIKPRRHNRVARAGR